MTWTLTFYSRRCFAHLLTLIALLSTSWTVYGKQSVPQLDSGVKFDEYGALSAKYEKSRLDNLATRLREEPRVKGYVVIYGGSKDGLRDLKARACRSLRHLVTTRRVAPDRVVGVIITGGHRQDLTVELWVLPREASDDVPRFQIGIEKHEVMVFKGSELTSFCSRRSLATLSIKNGKTDKK